MPASGDVADGLTRRAATASVWQASVSVTTRETPAADDEQARRSETAAPRRMERSVATPPTAAALSSWRRTGGEELARLPAAGSHSVQTCNELWTGTIGARRACTVSMISALSMPCRYTEVMPRLVCWICG